MGAVLRVGVIYILRDIRAPAPPLVALVGLLGILVGEQIIPVGKPLLSGSALAAAWTKENCTSHIFGALPGRHGTANAADKTEARS